MYTDGFDWDLSLWKIKYKIDLIIVEPTVPTKNNKIYSGTNFSWVTKKIMVTFISRLLRDEDYDKCMFLELEVEIFVKL